VSETKWDRSRALLAGGEIELCLSVEPVSSQANRRRKDIITSAVHNATSRYEFVVTDDVRVDIEWYVHQQTRYELDSSADVDNIIKPILDALCRPQGVIVDDCQVQSVCCSWLDSYSGDQQVIVRIKLFDRQGWTVKDTLSFVHMGQGLCYPILINEYSSEVTLSMIERLEKMLDTRNDLLSRGIGYYDALGVMSIQRIFHISRVQSFPIVQLPEIKAEMRRRIAEKPVEPF
jgi:Holliday junction resolvase RusA-like endonuclease